MKREFLKELGLGGDQIELIMAEHGKAVDKIRTGSREAIRDCVVERLIGESGTVSPKVLSQLISHCDEKEAVEKITRLKEDCPWLFRQQLPVFSAPCGATEQKFDPFRHGANIH